MEKQLRVEHKKGEKKTCARKIDSNSVSTMTPLSPFGLVVVLCLVLLHTDTLYGHQP